MEQTTDIRRDDGEAEESPAVTPQELLTFAVRAAKRHWKHGLAVGSMVAGLGIVIGLSLPPKYEAESRTLAVQSAAIAATLSAPNRPINANMDPFAGSTELLKQKSNLVWMARQANLAAYWKAS